MTKKTTPTKKKRATATQPALPLPEPPKPERLPYLHFNQVVTRKTDKTFVGVVWAQKGSTYLVCTTHPGKDKKRGNLFIPKADIIPYVPAKTK